MDFFFLFRGENKVFLWCKAPHLEIIYNCLSSWTEEESKRNYVLLSQLQTSFQRSSVTAPSLLSANSLLGKLSINLFFLHHNLFFLCGFFPSPCFHDVFSPTKALAPVLIPVKFIWATKFSFQSTYASVLFICFSYLVPQRSSSVVYTSLEGKLIATLTSSKEVYFCV